MEVKESLKTSQIAFFDAKKEKTEKSGTIYKERSELKSKIDLENKCIIELTKFLKSTVYDLDNAVERFKEGKELQLKKPLLEQVFEEISIRKENYYAELTTKLTKKDKTIALKSIEDINNNQWTNCDTYLPALEQLTK